LGAFPEFREEYFKNGFGGCVTVSAEVSSIGPVRQLLQFDGVYAAFGIHPHEVGPLPPSVVCTT
jgi:Tat protein secretion system quality control protein TatD with DNase activity